MFKGGESGIAVYRIDQKTDGLFPHNVLSYQGSIRARSTLI